MRSVLGLAASALAGMAAVVASLDGDADIIPFFVGLTFLGGVAAWAAHPPFAGRRRVIAQGIGLLWLIAIVWVSALFVTSATSWGGANPATRPVPTPEPVYLGLPSTLYQFVGLYVGGILIEILAFGRPERLGEEMAEPTVV